MLILYFFKRFRSSMGKKKKVKMYNFCVTLLSIYIRPKMRNFVRIENLSYPTRGG